MNPGIGSGPERHALVGQLDDITVPEADWPAYSAGYEAGLKAGIELGDLRITVELVPTGPAHAGLKLWRAVTQARLQVSTRYSEPSRTGKQLRGRARASWGLNQHGEQHPGQGEQGVREGQAS